MRCWLVIALLFFRCAEVFAQGSAPSGLSSSPKPEATPAVSPAAQSAPKDAATVAEKKEKKNDALGNFLAPTNEAITTEIYANEADFNSKEYVGTFSGKVMVKDPRFNLQADKLIVHLARGKERGLEKAIAEGNVAVVRDAPGEAGGPPVRSVGRCERAVYTASDGNVEMTGTPRVQSGLNTHVATSPETVMILNQSGQLTTRGPSRTELRQDAKVEATPKP